jgi:hypothetical protein
MVLWPEGTAYRLERPTLIRLILEQAPANCFQLLSASPSTPNIDVHNNRSL